MFDFCRMDFEKDIVACLKVLAGGGLILYPTDTIWGIGCDATRPDAVEKVYALKQRAENKAMIILVADEREILKWVGPTRPARFRLSQIPVQAHHRYL
jgi:L-threonylcarbamoyladenylate synthase